MPPADSSNIPQQSTGTLAFLFTDIEGSTRLWERHPVAMRDALAQHDAVLRDAIEEHGGRVFKTVGDAFCAAFHLPSGALSAAIAVQERLTSCEWPGTGPLRVRMAIHAGSVQHRDNDYFGPTLNRVARLLSVGHGGQILLSQAARELVYDSLQDGAGLLDMASHRLKDLGLPEHIWQVTHPSLEPAFPPLHSLQAFANNIPVQVSSFVGREPEMTAVKELIGKHRLVTLTGPGGCGKTRLALQVAAEVVESYGDGVWLVELAAITDPSQMIQETADALGLRESPDRTLESTLLDHVQTKTMLLVFDNCEHVIEESARITELLLSYCPGLTILCTSREPLDIAGERSWTIPSMPLPKTSEVDPDEGRALSLLQYDSVRLFVERAADAGSTFVFSAGNSHAVTSICRRLDGIPLAIELAAAATRSLNPSQISERLDDRFRLLTGGRRTASERQKTLRGMIDWSYELLTEQERLLLARLSVFAGGWTLEAAEAVCSEGGIDRHDVFDLLNRLVSKSLVVAHDAAGMVRYGLLETIRQYSAEKLAAVHGDELDALRKRHVNWCVAFADAAAAEVRGGDASLALGRMHSEHDNIRCAIACCSSRFELGEEALKIAGSYSAYWYTRGQATEGLRLTLLALEHPGAQEKNLNRASALNGAGNLTTAKGDFPGSRNYHEETLAIRRRHGNSEAISSSLNNLAILETRQGNYEAAERYLLEGLALSRSVNSRFNIANGCNNLGNIAKAQGKYESAKSYYLECLQIGREIGHRFMVAMAINNLGCIELDECRFEPAIKLLIEGSDINRELGDDRQVAANLPDLALAQLENGSPDEAMKVALEACRLADVVQDSWHRAAAEHVRACVELELSNIDAALHLCRESLRAFVGIDDMESVAKALLTMAEIACASGRHARGSTMLATVYSIRTSIHAPMPPRERKRADRAVAAATAAIGEEPVESARQRARSMTSAEAVDFALSSAD